MPRPTAYDVFAMEIRTRAAWAALGCLGSIKPAKQHVEKLTAADAAEGHALVTLVNAEVVGHSGSKQLQCLPKGKRGDYAAIGRARSIEPGWH